MIYVDNVYNPFGKYLMSHLLSDQSIAELVEFGRRLNLKPGWLQDKKGVPHFDISKTRRALAIEKGAIEIDLHTGDGMEELARIVRFWIKGKRDDSQRKG